MLAETYQGKALLCKLSEENRTFSSLSRHGTRKVLVPTTFVVYVPSGCSMIILGSLTMRRSTRSLTSAHPVSSSRSSKLFMLRGARQGPLTSYKFVAENPQGVSDSGLLQASADHVLGLASWSPTMCDTEAVATWAMIGVVSGLRTQTVVSKMLLLAGL